LFSSFFILFYFINFLSQIFRGMTMTARIRLYSLSLLFLSIFLLNTPVSAQLQQGGTITSATTWTIGDSPVTVTDSLTIAEGATLTIDPGVEVRFSSQTVLIVGGVLIADGSETDPILLTSASASPEPGDWAGVTFENLSNAGSVFRHVTVENAGFGATNSAVYYRTGAFGVPVSHATIRHTAGNGIDTRASNPVLEDLTVTENAGYGVFSDLFSNFELRNSTITDNSSGGVRVPINTGPVIAGNLIQNNDFGIFVSDQAFPTITDNLVLDNRIGMHFVELGTTRPVVRNNSIAGNSEFGIRNITSAGRTLDATRNFWGDDSGPFNMASNPSGQGDRVSSFVSYDPWNIQADDLPVTEITSNITIDQTWSEGVYWIRNNIDVTDGSTLTIQPGVIVKFGNNVRLQVFGLLNAQGTAENRIVFTSEKDDSFGGNTNNNPESVPSHGDWSQIYLRKPGSVIEHALIRFGGGSIAAIYARDGNYTLNHLEIINSQNDGIHFWSGDATVTMSNIIANNNRGSGIRATSDYKLQISDSEFRFNNNFGIDASSTRAVVRLLENTLVADNGSGGVTNTTASGEQMLRGNVIRDNSGTGVRIENSDTKIVFEDNLVEDNSLEGVISTSASFTGNEFRGNRYAIGVTGPLGNTYTDDQDNDTNIIEDNQFDKAIAVYSGIRGTMDTVFPAAMPEPVYVAVQNISVNNPLAIDPGVIVKVQGSQWIRIFSELHAVGTAEDPIVFTSWRDSEWGGWTHDPDDTQGPQRGNWQQLDFQPGSGSSRLEHAVLAYGSTNLIFRVIMQNPVQNVRSYHSSQHGAQLQTDGRVTFVNCVFEDNSSNGIYIFGNNEAIVRNSIIQNNGSDGLETTGGSAFREVSNSTIRNNSRHGVFTPDARIPQTFAGNIIRENGQVGVWNINSVAETGDVQFIGNQIIGNQHEGIVSSRARFVDNTFRENRYPIGVTGRLGNIYTDTNDDDGNVFTDNTYNYAVAVYSGIRGHMMNRFPAAMPAPVYVAIENVSVNNALEIDPGVIFKVQGSRWIRLFAELQAVGTEEEPIVFTSWRDTAWGGHTQHPDDEQEARRGDWNQLDFQPGSGNSRLEHAVVGYGNTNVNVRVAMQHPFRHSHIHNSSSRGFQIQTDGRVILEHFTIEENSGEGVYMFGSNESTVRNSIIRNNGSQGLHATTGSAFREVSSTVIENNGSDGVLIQRGEIPQSFSGNTISGNSGHGLNINSLNDIADTLLVITGNQVLDNGYVGIYTSRAMITDNVVSGNMYGLGVQNQLSLEGSGNPDGNIYSGNSIHGNTYPANAIKLGSNIYGRIGFTVPQDINREAGERPVYVARSHHVFVSSNRLLEVAPGTIFKLDGRYMQIDGRILAAGKADDKIVFTSWKDDTYGGDTNADSTATVPSSNDWSNLRLYSSSNSDSYLAHVIVRYANWNLDIRDNDIVIDSLFSAHAHSRGVYISNASPTINNSEIHSNPVGIHIQGNSSPVIRFSNIRDNQNAGLQSSSSSTVTAVNNYWGHESGPYVEDSRAPNLGGLGGLITMGSGFVEYDPWLTDRTGILLGDVSESGRISAFDASLILQYLVGLVELTGSQRQAADVMGTGTVTAMDASYILQFVVGNISGFPGMGRRVIEQDLLAGLTLHLEGNEAFYDLIIELDGERPAWAAELILDFDPAAISEVERLDTPAGEKLQFVTNREEGQYLMAAATADPFTQGGNLIHLRMHFDPEVDLRGRQLFSLGHFRFNEHDLTSLLEASVTSASEELTNLPDEFALGSNYPNPFNPSTTIPYQLPVEGQVTLTLYNLLGQRVETLVQEQQRAGFHQAVWDASRHASGTYIYRIEVQSNGGETFRDIGKMILIK
jgi:parallel beta-helix repeat protein